MIRLSQPLDSGYSEKMIEKSEHEETKFSEDRIKSQAIGKMFDDILEEKEKRKISLGLRFHWLCRDIKQLFYDTKYAIRNIFK